jgi:hypothetical protein
MHITGIKMTRKTHRFIEIFSITLFRLTFDLFSFLLSSHLFFWSFVPAFDPSI